MGQSSYMAVDVGKSASREIGDLKQQRFDSENSINGMGEKLNSFN